MQNTKTKRIEGTSLHRRLKPVLTWAIQAAMMSMALGVSNSAAQYSETPGFKAPTAAPAEAPEPWVGPAVSRYPVPELPVKAGAPLAIPGDSDSLFLWKLGVEQWENGNRSDFRRELWDVNCDRKQQTCSIDRLVMTSWGGDLGTFVSQHHHTERDGSLRDVHADWEQQRFDFMIVYPDGQTGQFQLQLNDGRLVEFRGYSTGKGLVPGQLSTVEFKLTPYSHTLYLPIQVAGRQPWSTKGWDEMVSSFNLADQRAAAEFVEHFNERATNESKPTSEPQTEQEAVRHFDQLRADVERNIDTKLNSSKLSPEAKARVRTYLRAILPTFERMKDDVLTELREKLIAPAPRRLPDNK
jgi:hypothetical protein